MASGDSQHIPIDIHLGQLSDWLISRRHCPKDWLSNLHKIREKLAVLYPAIVAVAPVRASLEEAGVPLVASELTYLHCENISQILSGTEHGAKNILGQYQSNVMKDLTDVLKLYEKDNTHLAELAQVLYRKITYDVPFLKKQMQKLDQTAAEFAKKTSDSVKSAAEFRDQYQKECTVLGIQGQNVREELLTGAKILPKLYENIAQRAGVLDYVCKYVEEFIAVVHKGEWIKDQSGPTIFAFLHHLIQHGNVPYPRNGDIAVLNNDVNVAVMENTPHFGVEDDRGSDDGSLDVNLNDTVADRLNELNGSSVGESIDFDVQEPEDEGGEVNWDLDTDGLNIVIESGEDCVGKNVLDNPEHRTQVINELHELLAFLKRRSEELSTDHMASDLLNVQLGDSRLMGDKKKVEQMIGHVKEILALFDDHRLQSLCKLHDSSTFLDRLTKQLEQKVIFCERMEHRAEDLRIRRAEALSEREALDPELGRLVEVTRKTQKFIEQDISKKYNERRVTILGGVQSVS